MALNCSARVENAKACWLRRRPCLPRISQDGFSVLTATRRGILRGLRLISALLASPSATPMPKSPPLPEPVEQSSRHGVSMILPIATSISSTHGEPKEAHQYQGQVLQERTSRG